MYKLNEIINTVICDDCLPILKDLPDKCIDLVLTDPPYGLTACNWDNGIDDLNHFWIPLIRKIKKHRAIIITASQPFTSKLVISNLKMFKCEWIWQKAVGSNFATLKYCPMKEHESVLVFGTGRITYNPQMEKRRGHRDYHL